MILKRTLLFGLLLFIGNATNAQTIITYAGNGTYNPVGSGMGGPATAAELIQPNAIAADNIGNIYFTDDGGGVGHIRKVSVGDTIINFAGNGGACCTGDGGPATAAGINSSGYVATDGAGNVYIIGGCRIRKVNTSGSFSTYAGTGTCISTGDGGPATAAGIPDGAIASDYAGNIYIGDSGTHIRKINTAGIITTIAGTGIKGNTGDGGPASAAEVDIVALAADSAGNIYFCDAALPIIRRINTAGVITTIAGTGSAGFSGDSGPATAAKLNYPLALAADRTGNVYISDLLNFRVRKINSAGIITTYAGNGSGADAGDGGHATAATISSLAGIAVDREGNVFVAEHGGERVRKIFPYNITAAPVLVKGMETLRVWPNPAYGIFTINMYSPTNEAVLVKVTNMVGETIKELTVTTNKETEVPLHAPSGVYFISAVSSSGRQVSKVIIQ